VTFVGRVGLDAFGDQALQTWKREGIETRYVIRDPETATGVAPIFVEEGTGMNMIVVVLGANLKIERDDIDAAEEAIARADVMLTQLEIDPGMTAYALQAARRHGVTAILNPAPAVALPRETLALADYITPNETELETLAGLKADGALDVARAARTMLARDEQAYVVTLGEKGAHWVTKGTDQRASAFDVSVVDTTGAGDAFNGGLAVALGEGMAIAEALRFANATAALSVTRPGTAPSMPHRAEVDALLASPES
jgi:ribokinase